MEPVKKGYKKTEVGIIPEEWSIYTLREVANYRRGSFPQPYGLSKWYDDLMGAPFVQVYDVDTNNKLKASTKQNISKEAQALSVFVPKGTVVLTLQGSIGRIALTQYDAYVDRTLLIFESYRLVVDKYYFLLVVKELFNKEKQNAPGGTIKTITKEALSVFNIPLPPTLTEQKAIADALSDVDELIASLEKLIAKKKAIKQGAMQALLTPPHKGGKRLDGFSGEWKEVMLGDCLKYEQPTKYLVNSTEYEGKSQTPVLTAGKSFLLGYTDEDFGIYENLPVIIFDDFTTSNQFVNFKFKVKSSAMKMLTPISNAIDITFIHALMQTIKYSLGDEHKRRWIAEFSKINVSIPEIAEQKAISKILNDLDEEITIIGQGLDKQKVIKQGMMQELLTGKTRLV